MSRQANFSEIPIISLSALGRGDEAEAATIEAIRRASEEVGFFYAKDHGVSDGLTHDIFTQCRRFFELPKEQREQLRLSNSACFRGYLSVGERGANLERPRDLLESLNIGPELGADDPFVQAGKPLHGGNQWPAGLPGFKETLLAYYAGMEAFGQRLLQGFALAAGMPRDALDAQYRKPLTQLRLLHYPAQQAIVDNMLGARAHRDVGLFTILLQDGVGGLEVCNAAGEWVVAPPVPDTFVINVGEMMKLITNDHYASALHRVVNRSGRERYSVPFFFNPDYDATLSALPQFIAANEASRFKPIHAGEHMFNFYRNLWPSAGSTAASTPAPTVAAP
ncbi:2-oxoglutarate and iron-dependent oxygenase domain-containing protein [Bradyrhizobium sp. dw_78]|uniref:isopenicillin N synthase family dioxygenase n=1 Tax=Bradyrhizobium sp. dw_78 TaxID=2719793 RepID=UPI00201CA30E|nr:2-oxoglutarate and iron-dependent oxygenase domain-containing protein [Bradyrhizobium sp. dw_78]